MEANGSALASRGPTGLGRLMPSTGADLALSLFYVNTLPFHPMLDRVVFLGDSDTETQWAEVSGLLNPGGWQCDALCSPP